MKKTLFALAAAVLLIGAGCQNAPSADLGQGIKVQVDHPGITVTAGEDVNASATSPEQGGGQDAVSAPSGQSGDVVNAPSGGGEREDGEGGGEREGGDDEEGGGRSATPPAPAPATGKSYAMAQIAAHASASSCWSAIGGSVYDLTGWINQHPGGSQAILSLCGIDGTAGFNAQHGGQGNPAAELAALRIGALVK